MNWSELPWFDEMMQRGQSDNVKIEYSNSVLMLVTKHSRLMNWSEATRFDDMMQILRNIIVKVDYSNSVQIRETKHSRLMNWSEATSFDDMMQMLRNIIVKSKSARRKLKKNSWSSTLRRGKWTAKEDELAVTHQKLLGNKWAKTAKQLPGRSSQA